MPACSAEKSHNHLKVMVIFRTLGLRSISVTAMLNLWGKANTSIDGLGRHDTATRQTRDIEPMLNQCWAIVYDADPTLVQPMLNHIHHRVDVLCLLISSVMLALGQHAASYQHCPGTLVVRQ